ncbi:4524_t:CDS:2, partial [Gigaspora rosea]
MSRMRLRSDKSAGQLPEINLEQRINNLEQTIIEHEQEITRHKEPEGVLENIVNLMQNQSKRIIF